MLLLLLLSAVSQRSVAEYLLQAQAAGRYNSSLLPRCFAAAVEADAAAAAACWWRLFGVDSAPGVLATDQRLAYCYRQSCSCRSGQWDSAHGCQNVSAAGCAAEVGCVRVLGGCVGAFLPPAAADNDCAAAAIGSCVAADSAPRAAVAERCPGAWRVGLPEALDPAGSCAEDLCGFTPAPPSPFDLTSAGPRCATAAVATAALAALLA
eukprot:TRINITY_DN2815_c0_g1_i3.p1 TRINITY_DN2815_c0_g1~~TRINITY_DN2815_c0_g1_i3.p1  ORF type:complete len:208 (+),score=54.34 TRINITY_DN2815_c0_g1_i3:56-679(+)